MIQPRLFISAGLLLVAGNALAQGPEPTPRPTPVPTISIQKSRLGGATELRKAEPPAGESPLAGAVRRSREAHGEAPRRSLGVITNETLKGPNATPEAAPKGAKSKGTPAAARPPAPPMAVIPVPEARDSKGRTEAEWRSIAASARARVAKAEADVSRLEVETKRLENDFYAWSDGNYRDRVIKPSWDQAKDDLKRARLEVDQAQAALADLADEARKSGAPPGWLREGKAGPAPGPTVPAIQ